MRRLVNRCFTSFVRADERAARAWRGMTFFPFVSDAQALADADRLIARYGDDAGFEAAARAEASRDKGNAIHFCRWREIERLIAILAHDGAMGTLH